MMNESNAIAALQSERRSGPAGDYSGSERRILSFGVQYTCHGSVIDVGDWLDDHCQEDYSLVIDDIDDEMINKTLRIMFETESDKATFINEYKKR